MAIIKKKVMVKSMKKAQDGTMAKKKPAKTYPIISEEGDLADALNETMRMRKAGTAPKTNAGGMKVMDRFQKEGKLGPAKPKMKMGGAMAKQAAVAIAMKKAGKAPKKKMQYGGDAASMVPPAMMKKGGSMKKCKYGCK